MAVNYRYSCPLPVHVRWVIIWIISLYFLTFLRAVTQIMAKCQINLWGALTTFVGTVRTVLTLCGAQGTVPQLCPPPNFGGLAELWQSFSKACFVLVFDWKITNYEII